MKQHLPTTGEHTLASVPARHQGLPQHQGTSRPRIHAAAARANANNPAICAKRTAALGIDGTWQDTAFARITMVFAPYHQRPKDPVT